MIQDFPAWALKPKRPKPSSDFLKQEPQILVEAFGSHLIFGENLADKNSPSQKQLKAFKKLQAIFPKMSSHLLNTAGLVSQYVNTESGEWGARPGIGLYGIKPKVYTKDQQAKKKWRQLALKPSSSLKKPYCGLNPID